MATRRLSRSPQMYASASRGIPLAEGMAVSVTARDGMVIATVSRRLEPTGDVDGERWVVYADGDVDLDTAPLLEQALMIAINERARTCLDLRRVDFFGAAGVHVLLRAHRHATGLGHSLTLRGVHGVTERVLTIVGLDRVFAMTA